MTPLQKLLAVFRALKAALPQDRNDWVLSRYSPEPPRDSK